MKNHQITIQKLTTSNIGQLQEISKQTFAETFQASNSVENMNAYLEKSFSIEKLAKELANPYSGFYFALANTRVVGYLKVNWGPSQTENPDENGLEIERIYVLKEFLGKKVGQVLYEKAIEISTQKGVDFVWLGVWEENQRAIRFYQKNGFEAFDKHIFQLGEDKQTDILMKRKI
ncbi:GNAT family N-acetyltransferase [Mangrovibacterium marinum]|uniref:GNAT family N-acetyltransferase n=1 Tax=Mangrovibacterium marinum TaxID=1639118 RepID=UPI002A18BCD2|nr:GNAT family N-acetyltransferase [Mangrovibacterium marinum]